MSKFDYCSFSGGEDDFAVSKEKFTYLEAVEIFKKEACYSDISKYPYIAICDAYVRHRAGVNEDNEPCVGWWLEYEQHKRSCPVWAFHQAKTVEEWCKGYEYIKRTESEGGAVNG